jgi:hypothetical protein
MTLYTRHQLLLVLLIVGAAGAGLAIDHWRRASPEVVERLERADRAERPAAEPAARDARRTPRPPALDSRRVSRDARPRERARPDAPPPAPLDVNRASAPELARLPGLGPVLAARIVEARPFDALDELARVRGLRRATLERVRPLLAISP